jgi:exosome complex component RRP42
LDEQRVATARLNVGVTKDGHICSMQKGGKYPLTKDEVLYCVNTAITKVKELIEYL